MLWGEDGAGTGSSTRRHGARHGDGDDPADPGPGPDDLVLG
jgi:hypothetical protein